uniref:Uncharacterized protein n=1 Tax=Pyramimonas obovata TaxID=1411642 RepID=A0A7S0RQ07_9CHLO
MFFKKAFPPPSSSGTPGLSTRGLQATNHAEYKARQEEMERLRTSRQVGEFQYILAQAQLSRQQYGLAAARAAQCKASTTPPLFRAEQQVELTELQAKAADIVASLHPACERFARLQEATLFEQEFTTKLAQQRRQLALLRHVVELLLGQLARHRVLGGTMQAERGQLEAHVELLAGVLDGVSNMARGPSIRASALQARAASKGAAEPLMLPTARLRLDAPAPLALGAGSGQSSPAAGTDHGCPSGDMQRLATGARALQRALVDVQRDLADHTYPLRLAPLQVLQRCIAQLEAAALAPMEPLSPAPPEVPGQSQPLQRHEDMQAERQALLDFLRRPEVLVETVAGLTQLHRRADYNYKAAPQPPAAAARC